MYKLTMGLRFSTRWMPTIPRNAPKLSWRNKRNVCVCNLKPTGSPYNLFYIYKKNCFTHGDAGVISRHGHVVGASGWDETDGEDHQSQRQQTHGHPQSRLPSADIETWKTGRRKQNKTDKDGCPVFDINVTKYSENISAQITENGYMTCILTVDKHNFIFYTTKAPSVVVTH